MIAYSLNISWLFQGLEQFDKIIVRNIIVKLLSIFVIFIFVKNQNDLWKYILIFSLSEFFGNISLWLYLPSRLVKIDIRKLKFKYHFLPTVMMFLPQVAIQIYTVLDKTMVGLLTKDMNQVGYYEQAQNIAKAVLVIMSSVQVVMNSRVANANAIKDKKEVKECLRKSFEFVWLFGIPLMFGLIACSSNIVPWYYGPGFDSVKPLLISSCPLIIVIGLNGITGIVYLIHTDQQNAFTKSVVIGALTNIVFNFILINLIGTIGATISSVIAETVIFVLHFKYIKKIYNIYDIFKPCVKPIVSGLIMFVIVYFASLHLSPSILHTFLLTILGATVYSLFIYLMKYKMFMD
ncbi:MAG: polysaccharide biosynthesis C-terminal domain-containing protein, partial [Bacilli bacterium]|nr:polysaccharide biosynthesis C-terminal domain-containing protein [Bacilli bacterium]